MPFSHSSDRMGRMGRTPDGLTARTEKWGARLTKSESAAADRARGTLSRSEHIRKLLRADAASKGQK